MSNRRMLAALALAMPPCAMLHDPSEAPGQMHLVVPVDASDLGDTVLVRMRGVWDVRLSEN